MEQTMLDQFYKKINKLKTEKNAVILAHYYQRPEIQDIADYVGDSLGLARKAAQSEADVIVFCGVHFMAESAAILSPDKLVLLPEKEAGCPMADMANAQDLREMKSKYPEAAVVSYVNTTAAVKAESYICCTSSNAVKVINSLPGFKQVIFTPDRNLGQYVASQCDKEIILWEGYCNTHDRVTPEDIISKKDHYPQAEVVVHPECRPEVVALSDYTGSTAGMLKYIKDSDRSQFIIGTEQGLLHALKKQNPAKEMILASKKLICPNMKLTTLPKIVESLTTMRPIITVEKEIARKAYLALDRMLKI